MVGPRTPLAPVLGLLLLLGCPTGPGPDPVPTGVGACSEGPLECDWGLGCHDGVCGSCVSADECHPYAGCRDNGTCGECDDSADCRPDEVCLHRQCMPAALPVWELTVDPEQWGSILDDPEHDTYIPCTLTVGDLVYEGADLRLRGGSTRSYPKQSLRIRFPEDAEHPGYSRKINLRAEYNDPSFLRTFLGFEFFRRSVSLPTPRARYLELYLNGGYHGLMLETERIAGKFLRLRGRDRDRSMYEAVDVDDEGALTPNDDEEEYRAIYEKSTGDPADYADLIELIEGTLLADHQDWTESGVPLLQRTRGAVHLDSYLTYLALMAVLQSQDHVTNNFYFSGQQAGGGEPRWEFYAADMDLTFGCRWDEANDNSLCDEFTYDGWWMNGWIPDDVEIGSDPAWGNLLIHLVLQDPLLWPVYQQEVCGILAGESWNEGIPDLIDAVHDTIASAAAADPNDLNDDLEDLDAAQEEVRSFVSLRRAYLAEQLTCP